MEKLRNVKLFSNYVWPDVMKQIIVIKLVFDKKY